VLLLLVASLFAQDSKPQADTTFISRAKKAIISNFDPALPSLTLESFLKYETDDTTIDWKDSECEDLRLKNDQHAHGAKCVTAYSSLSDARVITVTVRVANDISKTLTLLAVTVIDRGLEQPIQLIQVPAVAQRNKIPGQPQHRWPRDLLPLSRVS
jgi:hypothetical protein